MIKKILPEKIYLKLIQSLLLIYLFYALLRILFYLFTQSLFLNITISDLVYYLLVGTRFDTLAIFYTNALFILLLILPFHFRYHKTYIKVCIYIYIITNAIAFIPNIADFVYYNFIQRRTNFSIFREFKNETNFFDFIKNFILDYWYLFLIYACFLYVLLKGIKWIWKKRDPPIFTNKIHYYSRASIYFCLSVYLFVIGIRGGFKPSTRPITMSNAGEYVKNTKEQDLVLNSTFTILKTIEQTFLEDHQYFATNQETEQYFSTISYPNSVQDTFQRKNIVIIIMESIGKETMGFFNQERIPNFQSCTPFLDSLCKQSLVFTNSYSNTRQSIDGMPAILTGIPRMQESFISTPYYSNNIQSLPSILKSEGYVTSFFHGAPDGAMGFWAFLKNNGFEHYFSKEHFNDPSQNDGIWGIWDEPFLQFFADKLNTFKTPFFSTIFTLTSHYPFHLPKEYENRFQEGVLPLYKCIRYSDMAIKNFFEKAKKMPWYKNTIFVLTADHCQSYPQDPYYQTPIGLYRVPIIIFNPDKPIKKMSSNLIQHIDIYPTILDLLNYPKPFFSLGKSALRDSLKPSHFIINVLHGNYYIWDKHYLLEFNYLKQKANSLYDIVNDPMLTNNILDKNEAIKNRMENQVKAFIQKTHFVLNKDQMTYIIPN